MVVFRAGARVIKPGKSCR